MIKNFGGNVSFAPQQRFTPRNEAELLEILRQSRGRRIRAIGRLHSWSEALVADDVLIDLQYINAVRVEDRDGKHWVTVGAGCQIKRVLAELDRLNAGTVPALGLITEQTIAGAISTGTHGSGRYCMSQFVEEVRIATYDAATGEPVIHTVNGGDELRAARCSLGALGIIVSVSFWSRPQYAVEEHFQRYTAVEDVLACETEYPLQQFYLMPWLWQYFAQHRRETPNRRNRLVWLYRLYTFLTLDVALHLGITSLVRFRPWPGAIRFFYRNVVPMTVIRNWKVTGKSQSILVMEHELFRHVECEIFVKRSRLLEAINFATQLIKHVGGDVGAMDATTRDQLNALGIGGEVEQAAGSYTHHFPICIRRVLPDDTLISMASGGDESYYAISFISYEPISRLWGFMSFVSILTIVTTNLFDARPHWGKVCLVAPSQAARLYPRLAEFREIAGRFDPNGVFRNEFLDRIVS